MAKRVQLLKDALSLDNTNEKQIIAICADIDLTGEKGIEIWDCRSLIAPRRFRRSARWLGPRVYITDEEERGRESLFDGHCRPVAKAWELGRLSGR
jgi:hypothetical protein